MAEQSYYSEQNKKNTIKLRALLEELPEFLGEFFISISQTTSSNTRIGYAYDLSIFFDYIIKNNKAFSGCDLKSFKLEYLDNITAWDIDKFLEYVTLYSRPNSYNGNKIFEHTNDEKGKARKLSSIKSMYKYFYKRQKVKNNPASLVDSPKIHTKNIVRLNENEIDSLLDAVDTGKLLTGKQVAHHERTKKRDLAIFTLLLGTGMRVSECVGINISDINFDENSIKVTRKGGNESLLYFGEEVKDALLDYLDERKDIETVEKGDNALFLSLKKTRISVRQVQNIVKKYSRSAVKLKKITPHKLRSTYGTLLYNETGDIYLVADVLGHADVNTTKKHYAQMEEDRRKIAPQYIKLRKDSDN